ncbi:cytospin-A [Trichomycterus rosablanca]|uniref:cytospin-A n=1 Tax=Trichomycterus rosablanca TaxID=2290929 RepID=UPI002F34F195
MGNTSGKEQQGPAGTTVDQTPPTSPNSPVSLSPEVSHPPSPARSVPDPVPDRTTASPTMTGPGGSPSSDRAECERADASPLSSQPKKAADTPLSFFRRSQSSMTAPTAPAESPEGGRGCEGWVDVGLLQECLVSLGFGVADKKSHSLTDVLRGFLNERDVIREEMKTLKDKMQKEHNEWLQFQSDLQVALVVADRLRAEAEGELSTLREARQDWEKRLADAQRGRQEMESQMERLKVELERSRRRPGEANETHGQQGAAEEIVSQNGETQRDEKQKQKTEKENGTAERLKKPSPFKILNGSSQSSTVTTAKPVKTNNNQTSERISSDQKDNLLNLNKDKKEERSSPLIETPQIKSSHVKPQEDSNKLFRWVGGSKRNSMLRWCQNKTTGYQNIEITNFRSSWVDGLAFCAVYHSYLPSQVEFATLTPENKKENLSLAFQTGQNVGITPTLTVEEMLKTEGPDWQRVLGYVQSIYQHFEKNL